MRPVRHAAADPGRGRRAAEAGRAAALLSPRLGVGLAHVGAVQRAVGALPAVGAVIEHGLVDHAQIGLDPEDGVVGIHLAGRGAVLVEHGELHRLPPARLVLRILISPLAAPGTEPFT